MSETSLLYLPACSYIKRANGQNVYLHDTEPTSLLLCIRLILVEIVFFTR